MKNRAQTENVNPQEHQAKTDLMQPKTDQPKSGNSMDRPASTLSDKPVDTQLGLLLKTFDGEIVTDQNKTWNDKFKP